MTHGSGVSLAADHEGGEPRLQLKPNPTGSAHLDGAWWPRSTQLEIELPALVESLADRLGEVAVVGYHRNGWTQAPAQMTIADAPVFLQGFTSDQPASVILIGRDGRRVTLLVVSPSASEAVARQELEGAAKDAGDASPANDPAERVAARSVTEVASQLANHEGRDDSKRTAEIARWCQEAAEEFVDAPVQAFVPILVHHIVRNRMVTE